MKGVAAPDGNRYCWVKGEINFDTLRQTCIDPGRAFVGVNPPVGATPSQTIASVVIKAASWMKTPKIALNPGLVAIIGARGSGKTALADIIALGCDAMSDQPSQASFLTRAEPLVGTRPHACVGIMATSASAGSTALTNGPRPNTHARVISRSNLSTNSVLHKGITTRLCRKWSE